MNRSQLIRRIRARAKQLQNKTNDQLRQSSLHQQYRAQTGVAIRRLVPETFPLVVEACRRTVGQTLYDVQLLCGIQMAAGNIAEMKTGEGKTLTSALIIHLLALQGQGTHAVTFNDYLARRDSEFLGPVFRLLGLTTGLLQSGTPQSQRRAAYQCDITYGSAKEFGFDFLRDRLSKSTTGSDSGGIMRGTHNAVIDEADSILIDEARTPLIIGVTDRAENLIIEQCCRWAAEHAERFREQVDFRYDPVRQSVELTRSGLQQLRSLPQNAGTKQVSIRELTDYLQNAIKVRRDFQLDRNYAIVEDQIVILDEFTGRPAEGRQWQRGIHQAVEAREGLELSPVNRSAATVTVQSFFLRYGFFCGMTGSAWTSRREIRKVYKKRVARIPTHRPLRRKRLPFQVFKDLKSKMDFVADATARLSAKNRAVLIGTRSVAKSEQLSELLGARNIPHEVLNARHLAREAEIVALAGQPGQVTVATNMAGRGTDIKLHDAVRDAGGLHVIVTELHESRRIDWQLIGRAARQGDPGSYQICVSLEDEILRLGLGDQAARSLRENYKNRQFHSRQLHHVFLLAQRHTERRHLTDRLILLKQDRQRRESCFDTGQDPWLTSVS